MIDDETTQPLPRIVPGKSDVEVAESIKERAKTYLLLLLDLCNEARKAGFRLNFGTTQGPTGDEIITMLRLEKYF